MCVSGDTGPLVYPAGFVHIFQMLYKATDSGTNVRLAQYIFAGFYLLTLSFVFRLYCKSKKVPPYVLVLTCCASYRVHSIFLLRLFNDPVAMLLLYIALNLFLDERWYLGSLTYSLAVSVKMNVLLFAPALLLAYLNCLGFKKTVVQLSICASLQLLLGGPFLITNWYSYLKGSFDFGRIFLHEWTVNWRFLPENIFVHPGFHLSLLVLHIYLLFHFYKISRTYLNYFARLKAIQNDIHDVNMDSSSQLFLLPLFTANFIGILCSRSLHYQFYVWYFHSLPYLLWTCPYSNKVRLCIIGIIELCWNTFPSTYWSSALIHICHIAILVGLHLNKNSSQIMINKSKAE